MPLVAASGERVWCLGGIVAALLFCASAYASAGECRKLPQGVRISAPLSIKHIEEQSLRALASEPGRVPQVPLGQFNQEWVEFKEHAAPGDTVLEFNDGRAGGYALVRNGCVVKIIITWTA